MSKSNKKSKVPKTGMAVVRKGEKIVPAKGKK